MPGKEGGGGGGGGGGRLGAQNPSPSARPWHEHFRPPKVFQFSLISFFPSCLVDKVPGIHSFHIPGFTTREAFLR